MRPSQCRNEKWSLSASLPSLESIMWFGQKAKNRTSVIVFTTHKAGSMLLHRVLRDICEKNRIEYFSPNEIGRHRLPYERIFEGEDFISAHKGCFGPSRFFLPSAALETESLVLNLRDPRDVLTSMFYSYCFMHPGEIEANTGYRKEVAEAGIDRFVLDMSDSEFTRYRGEYGTGSRFGKYTGNIVDRYATYLDKVVGKRNAVVLSYEEMVLSFQTWLRKLLGAFALTDPEETYAFVMAHHAEDVKPGTEDKWVHKRKVTPGDYKEKLKPETIATLNERFRKALDALGYSSPEYEQNQIPEIRVDRAAGNATNPQENFVV
jgi:hypothetical protein